MDKQENKNDSSQAKLEDGAKSFLSPVENMFASGFEDVVMFIKKPWKLIWINFLIGLARGLGFFLGMTILGALVLVALHRMVDFPLIGRYIADIITEVKQQLANMPR
jgi:hypothetical protein